MGPHPRFGVQRDRVNLIYARIPADALDMNTRLRIAIDSGNYSIDADAVAEAILRRSWGHPPLPVSPSRVLVPAHLFEDPAPRPGELDAVALEGTA